MDKNILTTIIYYDLLDYPLTSFEVWKYLLTFDIKNKTNGDKGREVSLNDILKELENENLKKVVEEYRGFYFLRGRKKLVVQRLERNKISTKKIKLIRKIVWFLRFVPFVRIVAITGRVAMKNAEAKSDLDLLIVLKKGKIFTGRTLVTILVHFLGKRRYAHKIKDRICLNYFITTNSLEIALKDIFSSSEYSFIFPIFDLRVFSKFQKNNWWIDNFRENYYLDKVPNGRMVKDSTFSKNIRKLEEKVFNFNFIEKTLEKWEIQRISEDSRTHQERSIIIADKDMLVFLPEPQGPEMTQRFQERMEKIANL